LTAPALVCTEHRGLVVTPAYIWEDLGSSLRPETGYPDTFLRFSDFPPGKWQDSAISFLT